ncbi:MAG: hypothetical protein JWQ27_190 [Ferruginibacter sp.]|nr:hypothetical protein [Ferruginibacter sp.]
MIKHTRGFGRLFISALFAVAVLIMASCSTTKNSYYFKTLQKDTSISGFVNTNMETKIRKGDILNISVSSLSVPEDALFNQPTANAGAGSGFTVGADGTVLLHRLGAVRVEGLTRAELAAKLQKDLLAYMKEPIVNVGYLNHKVTVLGEVLKPQVLNMPEEKLSVIDVLVSSGDLTPDAKRNDVMIIRENGNEKQVKHLNLEDHSIFTSPWYYVQPNDIVYVMPDFEKRTKEEKKAQLQSTIALTTAAASFLIIILDRALR